MSSPSKPLIKPLAIYGAGGLGREVLALVKALPEWEVIGFFDDGVARGTLINEISVMGNRDELLRWPSTLNVVFAVGATQAKRQLVTFLNGSQQLSYPVIIHPHALILDRDRVRVGAGSILTAGCKLTTNVNIGKHVLINLNATVGHDCSIGDYSSLMPGCNLAGAVSLGEAVLIGSGANILNGIQVGEGSTIGAGSVVNHSIGSAVVAVGVPARVIKSKS
jgi:sugar O-acyltransferase (sialic acid O-acetyltransferase NeuD family)